MEFMEPFTTRSNLGTILKKGTEKLQRDYANVKVRCLHMRCSEMGISCHVGSGHISASDRTDQSKSCVHSLPVYFLCLRLYILNIGS